MTIEVTKEDLRAGDVRERLEQAIVERCLFEASEQKDVFGVQVQILLHEIITNAIRHSTSDRISINLSFGSDYFELVFESNGNGFLLKIIDEHMHEHWVKFPFEDKAHSEREVVVYRDTEADVLCTIRDERTLEFRNVPPSLTTQEISEIPEHFGLSICCQLCDMVTYQRSLQNTDLFMIKKKLR